MPTALTPPLRHPLALGVAKPRRQAVRSAWLDYRARANSWVTKLSGAHIEIHGWS
ncbi:hypothetical protein [Shewanella sp. NIFS-20-20]|uniref:hypothetical protein n=1 Tax=Shewanella sp. NIFS-20-20 TaxID=2853806 RepID=UPI001C4742B5|nr:hypothetical protein [Shewanella sp. NIFS-20-20]MBV7315832.1 hypothetical protein [Shewanella sp. NIFS-20-20]